MKILITGGAGFIGSAVIRYIIDHTEDEIMNLDKLTYAGNLESLSSVQKNARYHFERVDICDFKALQRVLKDFQPDAVMHLAAESHVDRSIVKAAEFVQTNVLGTYFLLEASRVYYCCLSKTRKKKFRFHHISTDEVYGDLPHPNDLPSNELPLFTEKTPYAPSSPYSSTKAASDHMVRAWARTYGLLTLITNSSNNYGPYNFPEKLIPFVIDKALEGESFFIYGKGDQIRDWLYVEDHVRALYVVLTRAKPGSTYNIGAYNERKNIDVVIKICELLDELYPKSVSYKEQITYVNDRPGHDRRYALDVSKIEQDFGWKARESFDSGLRKTVQWYLDNKDWVKHVKERQF